MKTKKFIGQLISLKFVDWKEPFYGVLIDYNDDWTLLKYNKTDYILDGYIILRNEKIESYRRSTEEKFIEKVLKLKGLQTHDNINIPLTDLNSILKYITDNFGVFAFQRKWVNKIHLGDLLSCNEKEIIYNVLNPKGKWDGKHNVKANQIRTIEFNTDYINSLKLISKTYKKQDYH